MEPAPPGIEAVMNAVQRTIARISAAHARRWPGIHAMSWQRSEALYGEGAEAHTVAMKLDDIHDCIFEVRVTPDRRLLTISIQTTGRELPPARVLQKVPYARLRDAAADFVRRNMEAIDADTGPPDLLAANKRMQREWARVFKQQPRPGRRGRADMYYAQLAAQYVDACASAPRSGIVELKRRLEREGIFISTKALAAQVHEARRRDILTAPPHKGVQGGALTDRATELLKEDGGNGIR
jgi:hypothetical protein